MLHTNRVKHKRIKSDVKVKKRMFKNLNALQSLMNKGTIADSNSILPSVFEIPPGISNMPVTNEMDVNE